MPDKTDLHWQKWLVAWREHATCVHRQKERRADIQGVVAARGYERAIDLTDAEASGLHLEGTGVFVLDRINGVAYVALSERADRGLAEQWVQAMGYRVSSSHIQPQHNQDACSCCTSAEKQSMPQCEGSAMHLQGCRRARVCV